MTQDTTPTERTLQHTATGDCPACAPLYAAIDADGGGGGSPYERVENLHERELRAARAEPGLDVEQLCGSQTWHKKRNHGGSWEDCYHETCRVFVAALEAHGEPPHEHRWVDARNEVVTSGEMCPDCGAVRPAHGEPPLASECGHRDGYGSTIIFVQDRPQDGVCLLCQAEFPALRVLHGELQEGKRQYSAAEVEAVFGGKNDDLTVGEFAARLRAGEPQEGERCGKSSGRNGGYQCHLPKGHDGYHSERIFGTGSHSWPQEGER
jgi:hypothetical protein